MNVIYETRLDFIELKVSCEGVITPIVHFLPFLHGKKLYDSVPCSISVHTEFFSGPSVETAVVQIEITSSGPVIKKIHMCSIPLPVYPEISRRFSIFSKPPLPINASLLCSAYCYNSIDMRVMEFKKNKLNNKDFNKHVINDISALRCPHCGTKLENSDGVFSCPSSEICPVQKGSVDTVKHANPELRLSYPIWSLHPERFISFCNLFGALAWPLEQKKGDIYNVHVLAPHSEIFSYVGYYMGITENEKQPFERRSTEEIINDTRNLLRDYDYL